MAQLLVENDASRLSRMLADYEAGRLYRQDSVPEVAQRAPIEHYIACTTTPIAASTGTPTTGSAVVLTGDTLQPEFTLPVYSLWSVAIDECSWVHLGRDPYSGNYFVISIPGSSCCNLGPWYCMEPPSGSGGSGCSLDDTNPYWLETWPENLCATLTWTNPVSPFQTFTATITLPFVPGGLPEGTLDDGYAESAGGTGKYYGFNPILDEGEVTGPYPASYTNSSDHGWIWGACVFNYCCFGAPCIGDGSDYCCTAMFVVDSNAMCLEGSLEVCPFEVHYDSNGVNELNLTSGFGAVCNLTFNLTSFTASGVFQVPYNTYPTGTGLMPVSVSIAPGACSS